MRRTVGEALRTAKERLASAANPEAEAEELLGRLLDLRRADLYLERGHTLTEAEWERLESWLGRRNAGEPIQYITGRAAFRDLDLSVDRSVLIPRPETEGLVEAVLRVLRAEAPRWTAPRVLDLGTGSGAVALAIASECPAARVTATDASVAALEVARANAAALGLESRVEFLHGNWFAAIGAEDRFEVVLSNPPYVATGEWKDLPQEVRAFEPHVALFSGPSGLEAQREIVDEAPRHLVADGLLALELAEQRAEEVAGWFAGAHEWSEVALHDDLAGRPRVLLARHRPGPASD